MPTVRALAAAVAGIDRDQENTCQRSLIGQKGAKADGKTNCAEWHVAFS
jgi:hypothetical protein